MRKVVLLVLLLAVVLVASALPVAMADGSQRVMIEFAPGKGNAVRNAIQAGGGEIHYRFDSINTIAATVPERALRGLARNPWVTYIEPDPMRYLAAEVTPWGITAVQAPDAVLVEADGDGVNVCIIDTGFGAHHEDLQGLSVEGESQVDDNWAYDGYGHGTHVAGTITAVGNDLGVIGVSPGLVDLSIVKIFDNAGEWVPQQHTSNLMAAAEMCHEVFDAQIISMSLGGSSKSRQEMLMFDYLYDEGVLSIAAAGNAGNDHYHYPASYGSVISVGAIDSSLTVADFSQFNDQVELAAPGVGVLSTVPFVPDTYLYVDDHAFAGQPMEFSPYGTVDGQLADGGKCLTTGDWEDMVVLCERGDADFAVKVQNVQDSGGVAAVIYNNTDDGLFSGTLGKEGDWIVAISLSRADGLEALDPVHVGTEATVQSAVPIEGNGYEAWNGTSMATPHVSGVAALLWSYSLSHGLEWTNIQIREAMDATALDLGDGGRDVYYGFGLVQAYDALQYLLQQP